jgi:hypothetical protein
MKWVVGWGGVAETDENRPKPTESDRKRLQSDMEVTGGWLGRIGEVVTFPDKL